MQILDIWFHPCLIDIVWPHSMSSHIWLLSLYAMSYGLTSYSFQISRICVAYIQLETWVVADRWRYWYLFWWWFWRHIADFNNCVWEMCNACLHSNFCVLNAHSQFTIIKLKTSPMYMVRQGKSNFQEGLSNTHRKQPWLLVESKEIGCVAAVKYAHIIYIIKTLQPT